MEEILKWRRDLHRIPEIGMEEYETTEYLMVELQKMGYAPGKLLKTGVYVFVDNKKEDTYAFRSDIDAIPVEEINDVSYKSSKQGVMHACGHDGHMSALLGFAKRINRIKEECNHNILLIFQPAEENEYGAKKVVETKIFEKYNVKAIFGMHLMPTIEYGVIASKSDTLMASSSELDITIKGKGAHAGLYHRGVDSIVVASQLITQYQTIISRMKSPFELAVISMGKICGGTARNIVADETSISGTVRTFSENGYDIITEKMKNINKGLESAYDCKIECQCLNLYPPVINERKLYERFEAIQSDNYTRLEEPLCLAEDFSYYQKEIPGIFFLLGTKTEEFNNQLHTGNFNFDEAVLEKAIEVYCSVITKL